VYNKPSLHRRGRAPGWSRGLTTFGIDTEYLDVSGLGVVAGRPFNALDASTSDSPVIVDRALAERFLNGMFAVGRRMRYARPKGAPSLWYEIVVTTTSGVVSR